MSSPKRKRLHATLEAWLWMLYWTVLVHREIIQRLKGVQYLPIQVALSHQDALTLSAYTAATSILPLRA